MSFIRPEAAAQLRKARPFILAGLIGCFGFYILFTTRGTGYIAGAVVLGIAGLIVHDTIRRARFPKGDGGPGLVEVDERRITYLSSGGGASVSLDTLTRVEAHRNRRGHVTWIFYDEDGMLSVPASASGSDVLFDAMTALPGVNYDQAAAAAKGQGPDVFLVWTRDRKALN